MTSPEHVAAETATPACHMPGHSGPAGHVHSCQLCPISPTYWRGQVDENLTDAQRACRWTSPANAVATP